LIYGFVDFPLVQYGAVLNDHDGQAASFRSNKNIQDSNTLNQWKIYRPTKL
jgi:hypothetical protein